MKKIKLELTINQVAHVMNNLGRMNFNVTKVNPIILGKSIEGQVVNQLEGTKGFNKYKKLRTPIKKNGLQDRPIFVYGKDNE